jgi:uncharacterized PurR-regulated membrane protein YhhQ (DUF165 family)
MRVLLYLASIVIANVVTAQFQPANIIGLIVPYGTWFIGLTFFLRDLTQKKYGRNKTYLFIVTALVLSAVTSSLLGDQLYIVAASSISFIISETIDTEIYTRLKSPLYLKVLYSGIFGGISDSTIFVVIGLSPLGMNFLPWSAVPLAILSQIIIKVLLQCVGAIGVKQFSDRMV